MLPERLTPQEHRPRKQQQPDVIMTKDGRRIEIFPNGDTNTILPDGTSLRTSKSDQGVWVRKTCGNVEYIPPNPIGKEVAQLRAQARSDKQDAIYRNKLRKGTWQMDLNDQIMSKVMVS